MTPQAPHDDPQATASHPVPDYQDTAPFRKVPGTGPPPPGHFPADETWYQGAPPAGGHPSPGAYGIPQAPPAARKKRRWVRRVLFGIIGLVVLFAVIGIIGAVVSPRGTSSSLRPRQSAAPASPAARATSTSSGQPATPAAPVPSPDGTAQGSCSYTLGMDASNTDWLTAEVDLTNTGNVSERVKVTVDWPQQGFSPVRASKTVSLPYQASGQPVEFHVFAGSDNSPSNIIDNLQNWEHGHPGSTDDCTYHTDIVSTYGPAH